VTLAAVVQRFHSFQQCQIEILTVVETYREKIANLIALHAPELIITKKRDNNIQQHDNDKYGVTKDADIQ
jgi:hypothetical protein